MFGSDEPKSRRAGVRAPVRALKRGNARGAKGRRKVETRGMDLKESTAVQSIATQVAEIRGRWSWVEPSVWTDRMLSALETGVKGGVWFSLVDKVESERSLRAGFARVKRNRGAAGVDHVSVEEFERELDRNLERLRGELRSGTYRPSAVRRVEIEKAGSREKRPLGIPTVRDRVVQTAIRNVLEPIFEREFAAQSYGFRPNRSAHDALERVERLLTSGYHFVVDVDLRKYFDSIPHELLMKAVRRRVADGRLLGLIEAFLGQRIFDGLESWTPTEGTPQGAVLSPLLSNIYLDPLDHLMAGKGFEMVRYADDLVVMCRTREEADRALAEIERWTLEARLTLHPEKTRIVKAPEEAFEFLGYRFHEGASTPRKRSQQRLKDAVRSRTRRANGQSLEFIIQSLNRTLRGWHGYFRNCRDTRPFGYLDGWIRMRLRSILRKRHHGKGRGRGHDHLRWPNIFFRDQGLFSLKAASDLVRQPLHG